MNKKIRFVCYRAFMIQASVNNLAPLLFVAFFSKFHLGLEEAGRLALINFSVQILADIFAINFSNKFGYKKLLIIGHLSCILGFLSLAFQKTYTGVMFSVAIYAVGAGFFEVLLSPIVDNISEKNKGLSMNILHSFYCWGQLLVALLTTILLWKLGTQNWFYIPLFWSILPIYNLLSLLKLDIPDYPQSNVPLKQKIGIHRLFVLLIIMMIAAGASELTMSQWASTFAQITLHLPVLWGNLAGPVLFSLLMGLGRIIFGLLWEKINFLWILTFCSLSCVGCYVLAIFSKTPIFALLACSFTGFTVSAMWPYTFSIASKKFPLGGTKMFGILAIFGDVGGSLGPWIAGIVSMNGVVPKMIENGKSGIKEGLFFSILFPLLFFAMVVLVRKYFSKAIIKFAKVKE